jgi:hypothetical protein
LDADGGIVTERVSFDPDKCRIKVDRIWLPRFGWVAAPGMRPLPTNQRLVGVTLVVDDDNVWDVELKAIKK